MSAVRLHLYSELDTLGFEHEAGDIGEIQTVWIRGRNGYAVSLSLTTADRAKLRAALDQADAIADKGDTK